MPAYDAADMVPALKGAAQYPLECAVIGAGPAGISAAQWLHKLKVDFRWFDPRGVPGGMLHRVNNPINDYPGGYFKDGPALVHSLRRGLNDCGVPAPQKTRLIEASWLEGAALWSLKMAAAASGERAHKQAASAPGEQPAALHARAVILATGTTYRMLGVPGESEGLGDYISQSASADAAKFRDKTVLVVGGGDAAFEGALILAKTSTHVTILMRGKYPRARAYFQNLVRETPNISFYPRPVEVTRVESIEAGCRVHLRSAEPLSSQYSSSQYSSPQYIDAAGLFVRIGVEPTLPQINAPGPIELIDGFIRVDSRQATNLPGLFAAGDITHRTLRAVATAAGSGATAAHTVAEWLQQR